MITVVSNFLYYTWLLIRHRGDIISLANTFTDLFSNRKMIKNHFFNVIKIAKISIMDNYLN